MVTVADLDVQVQAEFGSRLSAHGFVESGRRRWVRESKLPLREIFRIQALKGATYSPLWGISSGFAPALRGTSFKRQSSDKNAVMDLCIDPIDDTGKVPSTAFSFLSGYDQVVPARQVSKCATKFVPRALADFRRVQSIEEFCRFFEKRSKRRYKRFAFLNYVQHSLVFGFVLMLRGQTDDGMARIREFCSRFSADPEDKILQEYVAKAIDFAAPPGSAAADSSRCS